jgi:hypothetical protein
VAPDRRWAALALAVMVAACGGSKKEAELEAAEAAKLAALRARSDSIRKARAADSLAQAQWTTCSDSVVAALQKTAAGRRALKKVPAGGLAPDVTTACGEPKLTPAALAARGDSAAGKAAGADKAPAAGGAAPSEAQQQLARADSARKAQLASAAPAPATPAPATAVDAVEAPPQADPSGGDVLRETYAYGGGARDPFLSLINTKSAGPELVDLVLVAIYQDMRSSANSVVVLREKQSGKRHKLRTGDQIGRLRVAQIRTKDVVFTVEDFGFERQETLSLRKQEDVAQ